MYIEDDRISYLNTESFNNLFKYFLRGAVRNVKNLTLNWRVFYGLIEKNFLRNDLTTLSPMAAGKKVLFDSLRTIIITLRRYF
jgi:hypothetical protein